jgi:hypothetical protein
MNASMRLLQQMSELHGESVRLCPLFFDGRLILPGEGSEDIRDRIEALLARH